MVSERVSGTIGLPALKNFIEGVPSFVILHAVGRQLAHYQPRTQRLWVRNAPRRWGVSRPPQLAAIMMRRVGVGCFRLGERRY